ncbi:CheR family methyltransferase [Pararhodobacter zhoushanensis]|uniref:Chemotaxis protein methyltransferase n=1 Tax=Pararhodobacter zhoushanensis TaxID=2479545 RepID=A0ABT3GX08_9RHOB|nr:protein-glutamate O-methyltransferase CheR [Pararhodobacter zhoushanensis]MCW1932025.1 protein-glutamate O-methyltransferase CheR [Pararhodobacter zhoushanensis]
MTAQLRSPPADAELQLTEADFARIARIAKAGWGLSLDSAKRPLIRSRLGRRLKALNLASFDPYCEIIESGDTVECDHFITALTTNVTHFYREAHHFELLESEVLPGLIARARKGQRVRLWSAGCSSGQEPYSLAGSILALAKDAASLDLRILATDVDPTVLVTAEGGRYEAQSCVFPSPALEARLFNKPSTPPEAFRTIRPELQPLIAFRRLNLMQPWPFSGRFDVILCRNVAIYFDKPTQTRLWTRFSEALNDGGSLLIGHSERITAPAEHALEAVGITAYRKTGLLPTTAPR